VMPATFKAVTAWTLMGFALGCPTTWAQAQQGPPTMQPISRFEIDRTEVTIGAFRSFVQATGIRTKAEREGASLIYEAGWEKRPGWAWHAPYGSPGADNEPAVHVTHAEAQAYCKWAGKRLPTEAEWREAAYTERRAPAPAPFITGRTYAYPTGDSPVGANCLGDCGASAKPVAHAVTSRGRGHTPVGTTALGVNGLYDMGANAWEWVDSGPGSEQATLGGSWWYDAGPMHRDHRATKAAVLSVVYIGFRCARSR